MIYTHVIKRGGMAVRSPVDQLPNLREARAQYRPKLMVSGNPWPGLTVSALPQ
jgi:hypothetical protein